MSSKQLTKAVRLLTEAEETFRACDLPAFHEKTKILRIAAKTISKEIDSARDAITKILLDDPHFAREDNKLIIMRGKKIAKSIPRFNAINETDYNHVCSLILTINSQRETFSDFYCKDLLNEIILEPDIGITRPSDVYNILAFLLIKQQITLLDNGFIATLEHVTPTTMFNAYSVLPQLYENNQTRIKQFTQNPGIENNGQTFMDD